MGVNKLKNETTTFIQTFDKEFYLKVYRLSKKRGFNHVQEFIRVTMAKEVEQEETKTILINKNINDILIDPNH